MSFSLLRYVLVHLVVLSLFILKFNYKAAFPFGIGMFVILVSNIAMLSLYNRQSAGLSAKFKIKVFYKIQVIKFLMVALMMSLIFSMFSVSEVKFCLFGVISAVLAHTFAFILSGGKSYE